MTEPATPYETLNPATGAVLERYRLHDAAACDDVLDRAHEAARAWRETPFATRAALLERVAASLEADAPAWAARMTAEMGKPLAQARAEVLKCAWVCRYYAEHGAAMLAPEPIATDASSSAVHFDPLGVVLAIMPWNFPLWQVLRCAAPTLMAGNVVVLKHALNSSGCAAALERLFAASGAPDGVFLHLRLDNEATEACIADDRIAAVTLTGSVGAGRAVASAAGAALKPVVLELGGADPLIVLPDAALEAAVDVAMTSRFQNNGQSCIAAKRFIVCRALADAFTQALCARVRALVVGDPTDEATDIGPMARVDLAQTLQRQVERSLALGAHCAVVGGQRAPDSAWFEPIVLTNVTPGMPAFDEELFGPVAVVIVAEDEDDAVMLANDSRFGLGASVWTACPEAGARVADRLEAGCVAVNGLVKSDPRLPFGGIKDSGVGRELGVPGIRAFTNAKSVWTR